MIPRSEEAPHFNFPPILTTLSELKFIQTLQDSINNPMVTEIVLNFEKCHWFDILPLSQLLIILLTPRENLILHIVGPCRDLLPYFHEYILELKQKIKKAGSDLTKQDVENQISRHTEILPRLRSRAGSFLVGWGFLDILEENCNCNWYSSRAGDPISLDELRDYYLFGYGSNTPITAYEAERVWPFTVVFRGEEKQILERVNSEELIAGALRQFAGCDAIANGTAQNVLFFEPLENVFEHAYEKINHDDKEPADSDSALVVMRVTDWMYKNNVLTDRARWLLTKLPSWEREYLETLGSKGGAFMEIIISDRGKGIAKTLEKSMFLDKNYLEKNGKDNTDTLKDSVDSWDVVRYAFEQYSTRKDFQPPGKRGLAWIKERMADIGGLIQVITNNTCFVLTNSGGQQIEVNKDISTGNLGQNINGTYVRLIFPLKSNSQTSVDRRPKWGRKYSEPSLFIENYNSQLRIFKVPTNLHDKPSYSDWDQFLLKIKQQVSNDINSLAVLDFDNATITRWSLEYLFKSLLENVELHGRIVGINCIRQVMCRLDTVSAIDELSYANLVVPFFETSLRLYWIGADTETEKILLSCFQTGSNDSLDKIKAITSNNSGYFTFENEIATDLSFNIEEIEKLVRWSLGQNLENSLEKRGAIHRGSFIMPLSDLTVSTYIEPHQIFSDWKVANLLCNHLAVLLRWRFARLARKDKDQHVITATRIGRDIAMRMPEAYQHRKTFVYFDYHLFKPGEPRLLKNLPPSYVVIVVDIITTGNQVEELIRICENHGSTVLGVVSFIDFSPGEGTSPRVFTRNNGKKIEHKTFWRSPQLVREPEPNDIPVDKRTFCISPVVETKNTVNNEDFAQLSIDRGLRLLEDAEAVHLGHFELFGHHFEFVVNFGRLLTVSSIIRDGILREFEKCFLPDSSQTLPTAIILYPNLSNAHMLHAALRRRNRVKALVEKDKLRFIEARYSTKGNQRQYWLTSREITEFREWASTNFPSGYSILIIDDESITGGTLSSLISLARELQPRKIVTMVIAHQPPYNRTNTHREMEKQIWTKSDFSCFLHLPVPVFTSSNCPLCIERDLLQKELAEVSSDWLKSHIAKRIQNLDFNTTLHPQDMPTDLKPQYKKSVAPFSWENSRILPGPKQSLISRALSVRAAINRNISLEKIIEEVSKQSNNDLWRLTIVEICRRWDIQIKQGSEQLVRDALLRVVRGRTLARKIAALEALRFMSMEIIFPEIEKIVPAVLRGSYNDDLIVELILLIRRALAFHSSNLYEVFEKELEITYQLDQALSRIAPGKPLSILINRINLELKSAPREITATVEGTEQYELATIIKKLERILMTSRRPEHHLLHELARYLGDGDTNFNQGARSALDNTVRVGSLSIIFSSLLQLHGTLEDNTLQSKSEELYNNARILRQKIEAHMRTPATREFRNLKDNLWDLQALAKDIETELEAHWVNPRQVINEEYENWKRTFRLEFPEVDINVKIIANISINTAIIINRAIFYKIINNFFLNLKHAISEDSITGEKKLEAIFSLHEKFELNKRRVYINIYCTTRKKTEVLKEVEDTTTMYLYRQAKPYDVKLNISERAIKDGTSPWSETWTFRTI